MSTGAEVARLFARDASLWTNSGEDEWLGWIDAVDEALRSLPSLKLWAAPLGARHERVVLCGMGGSSLAPLVVGALFGSDRLHVLDSTDPDAVRAVPVEGSLFVIASKSGSTIEPNCFADAFWAKTGGDGSRFVAITDPGSALEERARKDGWARIAHGRPDVGGRYSALTAFGLVPAVLAGIDIELMLERAVDTLAKCRDELGVNPGQTLAHVIGNAHAKGRDKLTFVTPPALASVGLWLEQLIAESTGKRGKGLVPAPGESSDGPDRQAAEPQIADPYALGGEFFRWEFAVAVAGAFLEINPFDQPDVQAAKDKTNEVLATGKEPAVEPEGSIDELLAQAQERDYVCVQAFIEPSEENDHRIDDLVRNLRRRSGLVVTHGYGPRYLHSTGQLHKGGPNTGLFLQVVDDPGDELKIPGRPFGFRRLIRAQAAGDYASLKERGRRVARVHLDEI